MLEFLNKWISEVIIFLGERAVSFWENITLLKLSFWQIVLDVLVVAIIFYYLLKLIRGSKAGQILKGLVLIGIIYLFSQMLELFALQWLLDRFFTFLLVAIPIIFQHELRRGLEKLGKQTKLFKAKKKKELDKVINAVVSAASTIKSQQEGALIVFKQEDGLHEYIETGKIIDAKVSAELLISIFNKKSPLHDGAVIIENGKIRAASCVLPHSFQKYSGNYGTRHKAALGLSELTDSIVVIVSEEKSVISLAYNEKIHVLNEEELTKELSKHLGKN